MELRDKSGATALDEALRFRHGKIVGLLIDRGAKIAGPAGALRQLQDAVLRGQTDMVTLLLERGADANAETANGGTLLHDAALKGHAEIVQLLLAHGAKIDAVNAAGGTALHDAAIGGRLRVAELLLAKGAAINARDTESGATPLHLAASWGRDEMVEFLLARGANAKATDKSGATPLKAAISHDQPLAAGALRRHGVTR
jgi:ankyrin repeat protein